MEAAIIEKIRQIFCSDETLGNGVCAQKINAETKIVDLVPDNDSRELLKLTLETVFNHVPDLSTVETVGELAQRIEQSQATPLPEQKPSFVPACGYIGGDCKQKNEL